MARYFTRAGSLFWVEDEHCSPEPGRISEPMVPEHVATNTGLLDHRGDPIMRGPNPIGFGRDSEW